MPPSLEQQIGQGCRALGLDIGATAVDTLAAFIHLLDKWNRVYNLTAVRQPQAMVTRHVLDSLAVLPWLKGDRLLDVGTGAGIPGLVLAIARPELALTLLDSNAKKLRFVRQAAAELGLDNVNVVQARMQEYQPAQSFDMVISRAVASLAELYRQSHHLLRSGGRMLFMKGALPQAELQELGVSPGPVHVEALNIPGLEAERHLLWLEKA